MNLSSSVIGYLSVFSSIIFGFGVLHAENIMRFIGIGIDENIFNFSFHSLDFSINTPEPIISFL